MAKTLRLDASLLQLRAQLRKCVGSTARSINCAKTPAGARKIREKFQILIDELGK